MLRKPTTEHKREAVVVFNPETPESGSASAATLTRKKRVAAYARVSTEQDAQQNSYEAQIEFYTGYIQSKPEWEFAGIYADEGITGTNLKHRDGFNQMVNDAMHGKIDLILTKSISRFSRNTVDALTVTRQLKAAGVEVYFEKENLSSTDPQAEMIFTIMCTMAQEESRSISENVRWGLQRSMESGKISIPYKTFLGYEKGEDGLPRIVEEEAEIICRIYKLFLDGFSIRAISEILTDEQIPTPRKGRTWHVSTVKSILTNEKYKGDARLQKTYTVDFLTKEKRVNNGERRQIYIRDSHDAIISPETFALVQQELERRSAKKGRGTDNPFSGKLYCGDCGTLYGRKVWHSNTNHRKFVWRCNEKYRDGKFCETPFVTDEQLETAFITAFNSLTAHGADYIGEFKERFSAEIADTHTLEAKEEAVQKEIEELQEQMEQLIQRNAKRAQDQSSYIAQYNALNDALEHKISESESIRKKISQLQARKKNVQMFLDGLKQAGSVMTKFDASAWNALVERADIMADQRIVFHMRNGSTIAVDLKTMNVRR